jgi:hypothetical protein
VIEVADTTLSRDRGIKLRSYARAGVREYWIVNLPDARIEVHTDPESSATEPRYRAQKLCGLNEAVPVVLDGRQVGAIKTGDVIAS